MESIRSPAQRTRGGAALMKSVSLFVTSGRKASAAAAWKRRVSQRQDGGERMAEEKLERNTHFTRQEIEALVRVYQKLVVRNGSPAVGQTSPTAAHEGLDRVAFRDLLHNAFDLVTEDLLMDRIFCAFDKTSCGAVRLEDWVCGLSVFLRGSLEERTAFCFRVYDLNSDGYITRDEMFSLLRNCLMKQPGDDEPDEGVRDLVELVLRKLDKDRDGKISFLDFQTALMEESLLMEAFGQCLPTDRACRSFMTTLCS